MLKSFFVFSRFCLFWLLFFLIDRIVFVAYFWEQIRNSSINETLKIFPVSLWLDMSMLAYIAALPLLAYCTQLMIGRAVIPAWLSKIYVYILIGLFTLISVINLNLYREWGVKINYRAIDTAFSSPGETAASASSSPIFLSLIFLAFSAALYSWTARKILDLSIADLNKGLLKKSIFTLCALSLTFLAARGGWQLSPANPSMAYFSTNPTANHAALNTPWNLIHDILSNTKNDKNPYNYYSVNEARRIVNQLFTKPAAPGEEVLSSKRPNVVLIILESFTAEFVESLGGEKGVNPQMEAIIDEGILFTNIYAAAGRTDKGVVATLSGFPSQAIRSIMKQSAKQEKLPGIAEEFASAGYHTSFYYGGESEFFNMKSYILSHGYQTLTDQHSFQQKDMNSKWGTFDDKVFSKNLEDLDKARKPFFSTILTLTNHEPFELPGTPRFPGDNLADKFRSTAWYTDSCLGAYLKEAKKKAWYKNTLFVILADHGHRLPRVISEFDPGRYRIPLIFFGDVIKTSYKDSKVEKIGSQTDMSATLLNQLGLETTRYKWSKDLLNKSTRQFAFFNWDNGFGYATPDQIISYDNVGKAIIRREKAENTAVENESLKNGKAYMQTVFEEYLNY